ncbi:universal stress protein [Cohnella cellulosilytica]|uniref:Universal stress protein n=1 Tax=Cohnella cellulosilytica TaxID=986710 RepID=A0ABW2FF86_9BACL
MAYHHVLAAYDGSKASNKALQHAIKLVESRPGSKLTVAHVTLRPPYAFAGFGMVVPNDYEERMKEYQNDLVRQAEDTVKELPYAKVVVLNGTPSSALLEYARDNCCDLIVIGNRGLGPIREWMLGSVSHHVVQQAQIPVLVVK